MLALILAAAVDAGAVNVVVTGGDYQSAAWAESDAPRIAGVRSGRLELDDGRFVTVDGGVWLDTELAVARARDLERLAAENKALKTQPPAQVPAGYALVLVGGLVLGFVAGAVASRLF